MKRKTMTTLALLMGAATLSQAVEPCKIIESVPDYLTLFDAERDEVPNPWIQEFRVKLRAQYQFGLIDPAGGSDRLKGDADGKGRNYNHEWRRLRIGAEAKVLNHFTLSTVLNVGGVNARQKYSDGSWDADQTENVIDEFALKGKFDPVTFTLGKHKPDFIGEYRTSSSKILTIERSLLVNQLTPDKTYGLSFRSSDKKARFGWQAGVWVNGADEDTMWHWPSFDSRNGYLIGMGVNYATGENSRLYLDYMHSTYDGKEHSRYAFQGSGARDVLALTWEASQDKLSFMAEAIAGFGVYEDGAENAWGLVLMPSYRLTDHWEGVFRYQLAAGSNAIKHDSRYSTTNTTYKSGCDLAQGFYFGANYYVCPEDPHACKLMFGAEYTHSHGKTVKGEKGFTGWSFTTAIRTNF